MTGEIDVVIVTYNSEKQIVACLESVAGRSGINVIVVDNASPDRTLDVVRRYPVHVLPREENRGFAAGCNTGWRSGRAKYVLFLNPDAVITPHSISRLARRLEGDSTVGIVAPQFRYADGSLAPYLRRFPTLRSTYGQAVLLHRVLPRVRWLNEIVADESVYDRAGIQEWTPGACMLVRRRLLETLNGWDDEFFMYCEDKDLCRRARSAGLSVWYEPLALCIHEGSASAPRASLLPVLAASRLRYAKKHSAPLTAFLHRAGFALEALIRLGLSRGGRAGRAGHARSLLRLVDLRWGPRQPLGTQDRTAG